ncbi:MAG: hypothetical protein ACOCUV_04025 [bacterium]
MIFFSSKQMETAIRENTLTGTQRVIGLFIFLSSIFPGIFLNILKPKIIINKDYDPLILNLSISTAFLAANFLIIKSCYRINKANGDINFIENYLLLSIPPIIKTTALAIVLFILFIVIAAFNFPDIVSNPKAIFYSLYGVMIPLSVLYYVMVRNSFKKIGINKFRKEKRAGAE